MEHVADSGVLIIIFLDERYKQGLYRSWKVQEFKSHIFQAQKVLESGLGHGNASSWSDKFVDDLSE